jgi:hypothetical protein
MGEAVVAAASWIELAASRAAKSKSLAARSKTIGRRSMIIAAPGNPISRQSRVFILTGKPELTGDFPFPAPTRTFLRLGQGLRSIDAA